MTTVAATYWAGDRDATDHLVGYRPRFSAAGPPFDQSLVRHGVPLVGGGLTHGLHLPRAARLVAQAARSNRYAPTLPREKRVG